MVAWSGHGVCERKRLRQRKQREGPDVRACTPEMFYKIKQNKSGRKSMQLDWNEQE